MNPFQIITLIVLGSIGGAWSFGIPAKPEPVVQSGKAGLQVVKYSCSQVFKSENIIHLVTVIPRPKPLPQMSETFQAEPPAKKICKRGQKDWYYNKKKKRKMYRVRKEC